MFGPHQLPDVHGHIAELVAQQTPQAHEGGGIAHDLLRVGHHFTPVGGRRVEQADVPLSSSSSHKTNAGQSRPCRAHSTH